MIKLLPYLLSALVGAGVWIGVRQFTGIAGDIRLTGGMLIMFVAIFIIGAIEPKRPWRWGLVSAGAYAFAAFALPGTLYKEFTLTLLLFWMILFPMVASAYIGALTRRYFDPKYMPDRSTTPTSSVKTSKLAIISAVLGAIALTPLIFVIIGFFLMDYLVLFMILEYSVRIQFNTTGLTSVILGIIALTRIKYNSSIRGKGLALFGLITGSFSSLFSICLPLIATLEVTRILQTKTPSDQTQDLPQSIASPKVILGSDFLSKHLYYENPKLGTITHITKGELDHNQGLEIGIIGIRGALLMDINRKEISQVFFSERARHVEAVDVTGDGECEFMNRGGGWQGVSLFDHQGNILWSYKPPNAPSPNNMDAGDLDGDGTLEFVVGFNGSGGVHLLNSYGEVQWKVPGGNIWHIEIINKSQIVHSNAGGEIIVRNRHGNILKRSKVFPYFSKFSICKWPTQQDPEYLLRLARDDHTIRLSDFDGNVVKQFDAPDAEEVTRAWGVPVKLVSQSPDYFAVIVQLGISWRRSILYVYDSTGAIVFQEVIAETCGSIAIWDSDQPGVETLLIGGEGKVWQYTTSGNN